MPFRHFANSVIFLTAELFCRRHCTICWSELLVWWIWRQVTSYLKQRVMLGKFQTERKYCYAFHTTLIYSLKNFTFSLQAHAYGPRIAVLFWNTETCYSSKRTCPVKWILLSVFSLTWQPINFIYEGFFVIDFIINPPFGFGELQSHLIC